jgi:TM2 domain-containing membrane protein YozV
MNNFRNKYKNRYYLANVTSFGTIQLHQRNPLIIALWSVAFPGFGHILLHKFITGFALFFWEFYINQLTQLNTAMMHSFNGNIDQAKAVLNEKYIYLYIPVYLFAIWDSYRTTVDENKVHLLARRENAKYPSFSVNAFEMNFLDKKQPWIALVWSMTIPSLGQLYIHRIFASALTLVMTMFIVIHSNMIEGFHYFLLGNFPKSREVMGAQWFLYFPSIYFFGMYDSYSNAVELSKLFDHEQSDFLKREHQSQDFVLHKGEKI